MTFIPWGAWEPDSAGVDSGKLVQAINVYSESNGYSPIPGLESFGTDPLPARCVGASFYRTADGGYVLIAGTQTKLYRLIGTSWTDVTRLSGGDYNVPESEYWSFAPFGSMLIAVNFNDDPQVIDIDGGDTEFAALGGSPPNARYVKTFGDFVVLLALAGNERMLQWSGINDAEDWTTNNLGDTQEFPSGGKLSGLAITGLGAGQLGWVFQEKTIRHMIFQSGSDNAFRFEVVDEEHGSTAGYSITTSADRVFFLSNDGYHAISTVNGLQPIGAGKVNDWFNANSDTERLFSVIAVAHPFKPVVMWAYYNTLASDNFDRLLIYNWRIDRWTEAHAEAQYWVPIGTPGVTLEQLDVYGDIDGGGIPYPFDSRVWEGGAAVLSAIDTSGEVSFLEGTDPLDVTLLTAPYRLIPGGRTRIGENGIEPVGIFNDATLAIRVGRREKNTASASFTSAASPSSRTGVARPRASGRYLEFELTIDQDSGTLWTTTQGLEVAYVPDGMR